MLDVEAVPVVSVPVVAPDSWMKESDPAPLRFMSEVEDELESPTWANQLDPQAQPEPQPVMVHAAIADPAPLATPEPTP
jgi:hypothetical protein